MSNNQMELFEKLVDVMESIEQVQSVYEDLDVSDQIKIDKFWNFLDELASNIEEEEITKRVNESNKDSDK